MAILNRKINSLSKEAMEALQYLGNFEFDEMTSDGFCKLKLTKITPSNNRMWVGVDIPKLSKVGIHKFIFNGNGYDKIFVSDAVNKRSVTQSDVQIILKNFGSDCFFRPELFKNKNQKHSITVSGEVPVVINTFWKSSPEYKLKDVYSIDKDVDLVVLAKTGSDDDRYRTLLLQHDPVFFKNHPIDKVIFKKYFL